MLLNAYSIHDDKALTYSPPFYAAAHGQAVRNVMDAATDPNSSLGRHPNDYRLYCIGQFDDQSGTLMPMPREHIADVVTLIPKTQPDLFKAAHDFASSARAE